MSSPSCLCSSILSGYTTNVSCNFWIVLEKHTIDKGISHEGNLIPTMPPLLLTTYVYMYVYSLTFACEFIEQLLTQVSWIVGRVPHSLK